MRYTVHSYAGFWWILDNQTDMDACDRAGRRLRYHLKSWDDGSMERAQRKAAKLNAAATQ